MIVKIYSGSVEVERKVFKSVSQALLWAGKWQDQGFKVRVQ